MREVPFVLPCFLLQVFIVKQTNEVRSPCVGLHCSVRVLVPHGRRPCCCSKAAAATEKKTGTLLLEAGAR